MAVHCSLVVNCRERADLLVLVYVIFYCIFVTFSCGVLGLVWLLIISIPDLAFLLSRGERSGPSVPSLNPRMVILCIDSYPVHQLSRWDNKEGLMICSVHSFLECVYDFWFISLCALWVYICVLLLGLRSAGHI